MHGAERLRNAHKEAGQRFLAPRRQIAAATNREGNDIAGSPAC